MPVYLSSQKIDWKLWESRLAQVEKDKTANKASWKKDLDNLRKEIKQFDDQVDQLNAVWSEPWELYQANVPLFHNEKVEQEVKEVSLSFDGKNYKAQLNNIRSAPNKHLGIESNKALKLNNYLAFDRQMISEGTDNLVFSPKLDQEFHAQEEVEITEFTFFPNEITLANLQGELVAANGTALWSRSWAEGSRWKIPKGSTLKITYEVKHPKMIQENFTQVNLTSYVHYQNKGKEFTHSWDDEGHNKFSAKDVLLLQKYNLDPRRATHFLKKIQAIGSK
ncbi:hypothetical protein ABB02_00314 [Clostridiaceae bacterium JG1575]|nr:hypothetical protein ABB02_00314 [Clostridiaceae bacterium JG1575]